MAVSWVKQCKPQSDGGRSGASISMDTEKVSCMKAITHIPADAVQDF